MHRNGTSHTAQTDNIITAKHASHSEVSAIIASAKDSENERRHEKFEKMVEAALTGKPHYK